MNYEAILKHFDIKRRRGDSAQALCPCHSDKEASLTITRNGGRTLIHCHSGCSTDSILEAVGLSGVFDAAILDYVKANYHLFFLAGTAYFYDNGVYRADYTGEKLKTLIRSFIYPQFVKSNTLKLAFSNACK